MALPDVAIPSGPGQEETAFTEFLRDIMMDPPVRAGPPQEDNTQSWALRDLLDFGLEADLALNEQDYSLMDFYQGKSVLQPTTSTAFDGTATSWKHLSDDGDLSSTESSAKVALGIDAFRKSLWCWIPERQDHGYVEQPNFTLRPQDMASPETQFASNMNVVNQRLGPEPRDKIAAMVLGTCDRSSFARVMSSFPSAELLDNLMHCYLASHLSRSDSWIHLPTFAINEQKPELIASMVAAGALLSTSLTIRKLGFALQEAVRLALPKVVSITPDTCPLHSKSG